MFPFTRKDSPKTTPLFQITNAANAAKGMQNAHRLRMIVTKLENNPLIQNITKSRNRLALDTFANDHCPGWWMRSFSLYFFCVSRMTCLYAIPSTNMVHTMLFCLNAKESVDACMFEWGKRVSNDWKRINRGHVLAIALLKYLLFKERSNESRTKKREPESV